MHLDLSGTLETTPIDFFCIYAIPLQHFSRFISPAINMQIDFCCASWKIRCDHEKRENLVDKTSNWSWECTTRILQLFVWMTENHGENFLAVDRIDPGKSPGDTLIRAVIGNWSRKSDIRCRL